MLVLDIPQKSPAHFAYIDVPLYHRVHLSLATNVPIYACLIAGLTPPYLPELVISPFDFERWHKLWRLSVSLNDRPGLLHDVCDSLKRNGVDVLAAESGMMEEQRVYHVEMILDIQNEERLKLIEWTLQTRLLKEVRFLPDRNPRLRIRKLYNLWLAKETYERQKILRDSVAVHEELTVRVPPPEADGKGKQQAKTRPKAFRLTLPSTMREILRKNVSEPNADRLDDEGFYLRLSDTKDRFLRVLFFKATDPVIHARMEYRDRIGAAADVTKALANKGFNILAGYLGPAEGKGRARSELIVRCESLSGKSSVDLKEAFEQTLALSRPVRALGMIVGYPHGYTHAWEPHHLDLSNNVEPEAELGSAFSIEGLKATLDAHRDDLYRKVSTGKGLDENFDTARWAFCERLQQQYRELWPVPPGGSHGKPLFISCRYTGNRLRIVKEHAKEKGFRVFTGESLAGDPNIRHGIRRIIDSCTHFLGIWSRDDARTSGDERRLSPWLLWEFGIAEAYALTWRLLLSVDVDRSMVLRIAPDVQHLEFDADFETKLDEILDVLSGLPAQRVPYER